MTTEMKKIFDNILFVVGLLAGVDSILAVKLCMITGQKVYWIISLVCFLALVMCLFRKPDSES